MNILQHNINGLASKFEELLHFMRKKQIHIAAIQETKFTDKSKIKDIKDYTLVRKDRNTNKGGGLAFLVHQSIQFNLETTPPAINNDQHIEMLTINIPGKDDSLQLNNVYIPPISSCQPQYVMISKPSLIFVPTIL